MRGNETRYIPMPNPKLKSMPHSTSLTPWNTAVTLLKHKGPAYYRKQPLPILASSNCVVFVFLKCWLLNLRKIPRFLWESNKSHGSLLQKYTVFLNLITYCESRHYWFYGTSYEDIHTVNKDWSLPLRNRFWKYVEV